MHIRDPNKKKKPKPSWYHHLRLLFNAHCFLVGSNRGSERRFWLWSMENGMQMDFSERKKRKRMVYLCVREIKRKGAILIYSFRVETKMCTHMHVN